MEGAESGTMVLHNLVAILDHQRVKWFSNHQNVVSIIEKGGMKLLLQSTALQIFDLCLYNSVELHIHWSPRYENQEAGYLNRLIGHLERFVNWPNLFFKISTFGGDLIMSILLLPIATFNLRFCNP